MCSDLFGEESEISGVHVSHDSPDNLCAGFCLIHGIFLFLFYFIFYLGLDTWNLLILLNCYNYEL